MFNKVINLRLSSRNLIIILMLFISLVGLFSTYAWWRWSSSNNALVNAKVCAPEIAFVGGTTINGTDLLPVRVKEEGLHKDIDVNLNNTCSNDTAVLNLNLNLEYFPSGLADSSFKWALYEVEDVIENDIVTGQTETFVNSGNFANKVQASTITLAEDLIVTSNISTYRLYIWIDGTMDNPYTIGGNSFRFKLYGTGTGAIYNPYTMKIVSNSSATTSFWGSPINANQVKSIRFVQNSEVPAGYTGSYDVSSITDSENIMMYYVENGTTTGDNPITLYDVYVASSNEGVVKANTNAEKMFASLSNCEYIDAEVLDTSNVTNMSSMFNSSSKLSTLKISNWDTSNVTTMYNMFASATGLTSIDLSSFNTTSVKSMARMFYNCSGLGALDLSSFYTPQLTTITDFIYGMFQGCSSLEELNISHFDVSKIAEFSGMFASCSKLKSLDISNFYTTSATSLALMFSGCSALETLDISNFNTSKVTNMESMFNGCSKLKKLDIRHFNTLKVTKMNSMFYNCSSLKELDLSNFNTGLVTTMALMFSGCSKLETLNVSSFNTEKVTNMGGMFYNCSQLKKLDLSSFYTPQLTDVTNFIYGMFSGCSSLEELNMSHFNTSKVNNMFCMFFGCSSLTTLDLSSFESTSLTTTGTIAGLNGTFQGCNKLMSLNLSKFDFSVINSYNNTFGSVPVGCEIVVNNCTEFNDFVGMFGARSGLHTLDNNYSCTA